MTTRPPFLFVYGTLKRGHRNNDFLFDATYVGTDAVQDYATPLAPMATPHAGLTLRGEVYTDITPEMWRRLDLLEAAYTPTPVTTRHGREAILYVIRYPVFGPFREEWP